MLLATYKIWNDAQKGHVLAAPLTVLERELQTPEPEPVEKPEQYKFWCERIKALGSTCCFEKDEKGNGAA